MNIEYSLEDTIIVENFAPIIIPTLCRYEHLKKCLESLSRCVWAKRTEVYIGLDYPLNESHKEGYEKIKDFLYNSGIKDFFKDLHVLCREENWGAERNVTDLLDLISNKYNRWIVSEDDNVFSPNFLVYINKGLEIYENDKSVFAICGWRPFYSIKFSNNNYFRQNIDFSAWGYGIWKDRYLQYTEFCRDAGFYHYIFNLKSIRKIIRNGGIRLMHFVQMSLKKWNRKATDNALSVYMALHDMDVIMPVVSKVRNMGWDNSGLNCKTNNKEIADKHTFQQIDSEKTFEYMGNPQNCYNENHGIIVNENYKRISLYKSLFYLMGRYLLFYK